MSVDIFEPDEPEVEPVEDLKIEPEIEPEADEAGSVPRTIDVATWAARAIVVATIGLVAVVGGLLLGISVTDSTPSSAKPPTTTSSTTATEPGQTTSQPDVARVLAPPVKISTAGADRPVATNSTARSVDDTTRATVAPAPSDSPSPTSTATPRGKSTNTGKPKPTKP